MNANVSPEEKLLNLIKGKKTYTHAHPTRTTPAQSVIVKHDISVLRRRVFSFFNLRKLAVSLFIGACLFFTATLIQPWLNRKMNSRLPEKKIAASLAVLPRQEVKPYEFYAQAIMNRPLFGAETGNAPESAASIAETDLLKDITLVGIISGENPQAIIEDTKNQKTYYLNKGQSIGQVQVEDITQGKIIVKYNGQKYELYL
ncbi:MAG: type II secretion system protein N [Candidatus Omnitrophica bacterium]|nr:type II secretion system protein N [Candidatus Omnitrophota bacterium]